MSCTPFFIIKRCSILAEGVICRVGHHEGGKFQQLELVYPKTDQSHKIGFAFYDRMPFLTSATVASGEPNR